MRPSFLTRCLASIFLLLLSGCEKKEEPKHEIPAFNSPSATEIFDLQSKCVALGQSILENNTIGSALTHDQISHYNPADNRCYVRLTVSSADLRTPTKDFRNEEYLYDGQTGEMLAMRSSKSGEKYGNVFADELKTSFKDPTLPSNEEVGDLIDRFMHVNRQP